MDLRQLDPPEDGEYRGDGGHYCLLPPSRHPSGEVYRWLVPLPAGPLPRVDDARAAGFLETTPTRHVTERPESTEGTEGTEGTESAESAEGTEGTEDDRGLLRQLAGEGKKDDATTHPLHCSVPSVLSVTLGESDSTATSHLSLESIAGKFTTIANNAAVDPDVERAILGTLPSGPGRRNRQVFELARALKAIPRLVDVPVDSLQPYVRRWHALALKRNLILTEAFEETWIDFLYAWPKVRFPKGANPMIAILERAQKAPPPSAAAKYEGASLRLLVCLCRELQRESGEQPFFLSCRTAAKLLPECDHVKASRWLALLRHDNVLHEVEKGNPRRQLASRYRYLPAD